MSLLVAGTVAFDTVETEHGRAERVLGGSAIHAAFAASCLTPLTLAGIVGNDFPAPAREELSARGVDLAGLVTHPTERTFHWVGNYDDALDESHTLAMATGIHAHYEPQIPAEVQSASHVFLATDEPTAQLRVLAQLRGEPFVIADTRQCWVAEQADGLAEVMQRIDGLVVNEHEASLLAGTSDLREAGSRLAARGPTFVIVKRAAEGCMLFSGDAVDILPADKVDLARDPTGAGDAFAGGLIGTLAAAGQCDLDAVRGALTTAAVTGAMAVEDFSVRAFCPEGGAKAARATIDRRRETFAARLAG